MPNESFSNQLQTILDEQKEVLGSGLYKQFCDLSLAINKKEQNNLYVVNYLTTRPIRLRYNVYQLKTDTYTQIITLSTEQYEYIKRNTDHGNLCSVCCNLLLEDVEPRLCVNMNDICVPVERKPCFCVDEDDEEEIQPAQAIYLKPSLKIISVQCFK